MVEFVSRYNKSNGLEYTPMLIMHGAFYGSTGSRKSYLVRDLCLNGMYKHCRTIVFLNGKTEKMTDDFVKTMKTRWNTLIYSYKITSEPQLMNKINDIERSFYEHRKQEYRDLNEPFLEEIDMRPGFESFNMMIVIDDLHKEVICSHDLARKFQSIRHVGIQFLFVTQSFKNINMHDLIK